MSDGQDSRQNDRDPERHVDDVSGSNDGGASGPNPSAPCASIVPKPQFFPPLRPPIVGVSGLTMPKNFLPRFCRDPLLLDAADLQGSSQFRAQLRDLAGRSDLDQQIPAAWRRALADDDADIGRSMSNLAASIGVWRTIVID